MINKSGAFFVALGIFLSRIFGLVREKIFAYYFGNSLAADAFRVALRIPNFLQNLLGEGVLSASFIPVYAKSALDTDTEKNKQRSQELASVTASVLFLLVAGLVLVGVLFTSVFVDFLAPGFEGEKRTLTIKMVRLFFPATGLLVFSAFCLGVLNSHKRFFLSYFSPVMWNAAMIISMLGFLKENPSDEDILYVAWGMLIGSALQFLSQVPLMWKLSGGIHWSRNYRSMDFHLVVKNFVPALVSRGVVQVSAFVDTLIASLLGSGAVSTLSYAQTIYMLPISLFGMSVAAAELPEMSEDRGALSFEHYQHLQKRFESGLKQMSFFVVPSSVAILVFGSDIVSLLYRGGEFGSADTSAVRVVLIGYGLGLVAATEGRLVNSVFYALHETKVLLRWSLVQVFISGTLGVLGWLLLILAQNRSLHLSSLEAPIILTLGSAVASWVVLVGLSQKLKKRLGGLPQAWNYRGKLLFISILGAVFGVLFPVDLLGVSPYGRAFVRLLIFGGIYLGLSEGAGLGVLRKRMNND